MSTKISEALKELEIKVYENYQMVEWNNNLWSSGQLLKHVLFQKIKGDKDESSPRNLEFSCDVIIN